MISSTIDLSVFLSYFFNFTLAGAVLLPSITTPLRSFFISNPVTIPDTLAIYFFSILLDGCINLLASVPSFVNIMAPVVS